MAASLRNVRQLIANKNSLFICTVTAGVVCVLVGVTEYITVHGTATVGHAVQHTLWNQTPHVNIHWYDAHVTLDRRYVFLIPGKEMPTCVERLKSKTFIPLSAREAIAYGYPASLLATSSLKPYLVRSYTFIPETDHTTESHEVYVYRGNFVATEDGVLSHYDIYPWRSCLILLLPSKPKLVIAEYSSAE